MKMHHSAKLNALSYEILEQIIYNVAGGIDETTSNRLLTRHPHPKYLVRQIYCEPTRVDQEISENRQQSLASLKYLRLTCRLFANLDYIKSWLFRDKTFHLSLELPELLREAESLSSVLPFLRHVYFYGPTIRWVPMSFETFVHITCERDRITHEGSCMQCDIRYMSGRRFEKSVSDQMLKRIYDSIKAEVLAESNDTSKMSDRQPGSGRDRQVLAFSFSQLKTAYKAYRRRTVVTCAILKSGYAKAAVASFFKHAIGIRTLSVLSVQYLNRLAWPDYADTIVGSRDYSYEEYQIQRQQGYWLLQPPSEDVLCMVLGALAETRLPITELDLRFDVDPEFLFGHGIAEWQDLDLSGLTSLILAPSLQDDIWTQARGGWPVIEKIQGCHLQSFHFAPNFNILPAGGILPYSEGPQFLSTLRMACFYNMPLFSCAGVSTALLRMTELRYLRFSSCIVLRGSEPLWIEFWIVLRSIVHKVEIEFDDCEIIIPTKESNITVDEVDAIFRPEGRNTPFRAFYPNEGKKRALKKLQSYITKRSDKVR